MPPEEEHLDALRQHDVGEKGHDEERPVQPGSGTKPRALANGENGSQAPTAMMTAVVSVSGQLARLCRNGILFVRMTWMISVCVSSDSTNQPVWNSVRLGRGRSSRRRRAS